MNRKFLFFSILFIALLLAACQADEATTPEPTSVPPTAVMQEAPMMVQSYPQGDPRNILGNPDGFDSFDTANNWTLYDNQCFQSSIAAGQYIITAKGLQGVYCWEFSWPLLQNFYLETSVIIPETCQPGDLFGMIYRAPDNYRGYLYGLTCDGRYSLHLWDGNTERVLVASTNNPAINISAGQTNRLGVAVYGNEHILFVNGVRLATAFDSTFLDAGKIGYFVNAIETSPFTTRYDEMAVWVLDDRYIPPDTTAPPSTTPVPPPAEGAPTATTTTYVNVRSGPSQLYPIFFTASPGTMGEVIGQSTDGRWWAVRLPAEVTPTQTGWVSADYTTLSNPNNVVIPVISIPIVPPGINFPPPGSGIAVATAVDAANVRSGPGNQYESYGVAAIGQSAPAIGRNEDGSWIALALTADIAPNGVGWVVSYAVTISPEDAQLPVLSP